MVFDVMFEVKKKLVAKYVFNLLVGRLLYRLIPHTSKRDNTVCEYKIDICTIAPQTQTYTLTYIHSVLYIYIDIPHLSIYNLIVFIQKHFIKFQLLQ